MSHHRIKIPARPVGSYQEEIQREFEQVKTIIDELTEWARTNAPHEVQAKLAVLKSYTTTPVKDEQPN